MEKSREGKGRESKTGKERRRRVKGVKACFYSLGKGKGLIFSQSGQIINNVKIHGVTALFFYVLHPWAKI